MMKTLAEILRPEGAHWVGDGFPVRTAFFYEPEGAALSPFLLLDYAGPHEFEPAQRPRGVGPHPHKGFETVTIVYEGEVEHLDSTGRGGVIGPGDVQWMTAGAGIVHQEFHSRAFTSRGGSFRMVQLWINLPADRKQTVAGYQPIAAAQIPVVHLPAGAGQVRVIAGELDGIRGPARTHTDINLWDVELQSSQRVTLPLPEGHTSLVLVLSGRVGVGGAMIGEAEAARLTREGKGAVLTAIGSVKAMVLTGKPLNEPIVGRGPFVMNTEAEIRQAFLDFGAGRFGTLAHA